MTHRPLASFTEGYGVETVPMHMVAFFTLEHGQGATDDAFPGHW